MDKDKNDVYSKVVRAGKRTYFFDIKETRGKDLYLTITESKKSMQNGVETFQKHKIFLYKEDFEKFQSGFSEAIAVAMEKLAERGMSPEESTTEAQKIPTVSFEEL